MEGVGRGHGGGVRGMCGGRAHLSHSACSLAEPARQSSAGVPLASTARARNPREIVVAEGCKARPEQSAPRSSRATARLPRAAERPEAHPPPGLSSPRAGLRAPR